MITSKNDKQTIENEAVASLVADQAIPKKPPGLIEKLFPLFMAVGAIVLGIIIFVVIQKFFIPKEQTPPVTTIIVTPTVVPTPVRYHTNISTTSGFLALEDTLSSLSAQLQEFSKDDPALNPPSLVLPLGF